jgi:hypothetical protein
MNMRESCGILKRRNKKWCWLKNEMGVIRENKIWDVEEGKCLIKKM